VEQKLRGLGGKSSPPCLTCLWHLYPVL